MPPTRLMLLWHMHQPYYKIENRYAMPWVRLHALKDYYGMVAILRDFPSVHVTFNLVPSLVSQLLDYASGAAREESYELAFKPAPDLNPTEREKLVRYAFQLNHENLLCRYPRFRELFQTAKGSGGKPSADPISEVQDLLDLQVLSQLAWFDEIWLAGDPEVHRLAGRQRNYNEKDKRMLRAKEMEIFKVILEEYRNAAGRGQIEISTSPFYHPILPLLCDTNVGAESCPGLRLPKQRFRHPEDARDQLRAAVTLHEKIFGERPRGLWPSEGSVSEEALRVAAEEGFQWAAADEGVLGRSLGIFFHRRPSGEAAEGSRLYQPYAFPGSGGRPIGLFFRDHPLSDLIGFVYHRMDPQDAARDLLQKIRAAGRSAGEHAAVVSIILDGENAWEYYPENGREFLKQFYGLLGSAPDIQAMTPSEILADCEPASLDRIHPGSWINANFNVWIGAEEDNRAWDLLSEARTFFASRASLPGLSVQQVEMARQELWVAEGSDWCWWYGPEHSTANDEEFDTMYRQHLSNVFRLLGGVVPDELATPIKRPSRGGVSVPAAALISPTIDGRETTYFEWMGCGIYLPTARSATLHDQETYVRELLYGYDTSGIYLRLNFKPEFLAKSRDFEVHVSIQGKSRLLLHLAVSAGSVKQVELWREDELKTKVEGAWIQAALESIFEMAVPFSLFAPGPSTEIMVSLWVDQLPVQVLPAEGRLRVALAPDLVTW